MRKGQAALEFLSTYGFAFLALLVVLGVLSYLGVFNLSSLRGSECRFAPGFYCNDYVLNRVNANTAPGGAQAWPAAPPNAVQPYVRFKVLNSYGVNITLNSLTSYDQVVRVAQNCYLVNEQAPFAPHNWTIGTNRTIYCPVPNANYFPKTRYDGQLNVSFNQSTGNYRHLVIGHYSIVAQ